MKLLIQLNIDYCYVYHIYGYLWLSLVIHLDHLKKCGVCKTINCFLRKVHKTQMCNSPFSIHAKQTTTTLNDVRWRVCKHYYPSFDCSAYQHRYDSRGPPYPTFPYSDMQSTLFWGELHTRTQIYGSTPKSQILEAALLPTQLVHAPSHCHIVNVY